MTDSPDDRAERAFRDALRQRADVPDFEPLTVDVREPRRWPRWLPAAAIAVLVAAVAVPVLLSQGRDGGGAQTRAVPAEAPAESTAEASPPSKDSVDSPVPAPGWRWESHRSLAYQVPSSWFYDYAPGPDWCAGGTRGGPSGPFVDIRPERGPTMAILCPRAIPATRLQMFVTVRGVGAADRGWDLPPGWTVASTELAGFRVEVVYPDAQAAVAKQIVGSVRPLTGLDHNGCPTATTLWDRGSRPTPAAAPVPLDRVSVCQYDFEPVNLLASRSLAGGEAAHLEALLAAAPEGTGPDSRDGCTDLGWSILLVRLWSGTEPRDVVVRFSGCVGNGLDDGVTRRQLTRDVCQALLVPPLVFSMGSGEVAAMCAPPATPSPKPTR